MHKPELSIVIPSYNEAQNISLILSEYEKFVAKYNFELIYVNNGSIDESNEVFDKYLKVKKYSFLKVVTVEKNIGYGNGIMTGLRSAKSEIVAYTHADLQTPPKDVFRAFDIYKKHNKNKILVKGKRVGRSFSDNFISKSMAIIASFMFKVKINEINAQPKLFNKKLIKELKNPPNDFALDIYVLFIAKKMDYELEEFNVEYLKRIHGISKWNYSLLGKYNMIKNTLKYIFYLSRNG